MRGLSALVLLLWPAAVAADVAVRTGEHVGFTRVVLGYEARDGWSVAPVPGGWEFRAAEPGLAFDLSSIRGFAARSRLTGLAAPRPSVLFLRADCDCHVVSWTFRGGKPVLDLHDGPPPPDSGGIPRHAGDPAPAAPPSAPPPPAAAPDGPPPALAILPPPGPPPGELARFEEELEARSRARAFEDRLLEELDRAAGQGVIDGAVPGGPPGGAPPGPADHARVETAADRDRPGAPGPGAGLTAEGDACPAADRLALADWGRMAGGTPDFAAYAGGLTGEFDALDPQAVLRAARFRLYLGFGAEARQMLALLPPDTPDLPLLAALAGLLDEDGPGPALDGWEGCDGPAALWAVLAGPPPARGDRVDGAAVLRAFHDLPRHLQVLLAPRLIAAFAGMGDAETARRLRNAAEIGPADPSPEAAVAAAGLEMAAGDSTAAQAVLEEALAEADPDSAEVLLDLARARLAAGQTLPPEMSGGLEAHAYERRGRPVAAAIHRVLAAAEIGAGDYAAARARLAGELAGQDTADLHRQLYLAAAARAGDTQFLRLVLPAPAGLGTAAQDGPARLAVATRLAGLNFPAEALAALGPPEAAGEAGRLLAARAELALGRPAAAQVLLSPLDGPEATALMARAQERLGNPAEAYRLYLAAGETEEADRLARTDGPWPGEGAEPAASGGEEAAPPSAAADAAGPAAAAGGGSSPPAAADPYAEAGRLLAGSARDRELAAALLVPPPPE